jgi:hypothetical protein
MERSVKTHVQQSVKTHVQQPETLVPGAASKRHLLEIYLKDHHAAAVGGVELARRAARKNRGNVFAEPLGDLSREIEDDRESLLDLMAALGVSPDPMKQAAMWLLEKAGRLKPNGTILSYSPLSRVIELEALEAGVQAKREMWSALLRVEGADPRLRTAGLRRLEMRAVDQLERLEELRLRACDIALTGEPLHAGPAMTDMQP